ARKGIAFDSPDALFPAVALSGELGQTVIVFFVLGLIAAAYSSADSALTSLTTSFSIDILGLEAEGGTRGFGGLSAKSTRVLVHASFSLLLLGVILVFRQLNDDSVIKELFTAAGYTYGPLLGLYAFGLFTRWPVRDALVPLVAVIAPLLSFIVKQNAPQWFGYTMSFEHLILNGLLTFSGLCLLRQKGTPETPH
ncbi:MAG: sodium:solute symporter, partial [Schleiferiaceae bacterium]|nr:sodium:solute symporter [Schleiferiaceae bacterium]